MLHILILIDTQLFFLLNTRIANPVLDVVMPFVTHLHNWTIPIAVLVVYLIVAQGKKGRMVIVLVVVTLIITDQLSSFVFKPWIGRVRPCHMLEQVRLLVNCGGRFSFPSSHATNMAGFATIFTLFYRKYGIIFWAIALLIGFSRIYVGVHYPGDVLFGLVLGWGTGQFVYRVYGFCLLYTF
jgi:undecaprenyl-diphosphatase